jgi:hypothetical protein
VTLVEVLEKSGIGKVSEAQSGVWHGIKLSWDERKFRATVVVSLVFAGALAEVCSCSGGCGGSFVHSGQRGCVVGACVDGSFSDIDVLAHHV